MPSRPRPPAAAILLLSGLSLLSACAGSDSAATLQVLAASSLTDVMAELGTRYGQLHPDTMIKPTYGGSQDLTRQLKEGQQSADLLITADGTSMDTVDRLVSDRRVVAHNSMTIVVAPGNPLHIRGLADLADPRVRLVLGAPNNPSGRYAQQVFAKAGVTVPPRGTEIDVRMVLTRVRTGEADAGIVYVTDLASAGAAASGVPLPAGQNIVAAYPAAVVKRSSHTTAAKAFMTWLASPEAQSILTKYGFAAA